MNNSVKRILSAILAMVTLAMLVIVPFVPQARALSYSGSSSYKSGKYYTNLTKVTLTGDQRVDIVNIAKSQVGYQEGGSSSQLSGTVRGNGNYTEYGRWYGLQDMWCAMFVSWCANVAGVSTSVVPSHSYTPTGLNWFKNKGQAYSRATIAAGGYTPQPGDIIYFKSSRNQNITNHVGIVTKYSNGTIYTVEGNTSSATISTNGGAVCEKSYSISNTYIVYVCSPKYTTGVSGSSMKSVVFDATYYSNKYEDLKTAFGTDEAALYNHFLTNGIKEGRQASPMFDVKYYLENNSAVKEACGSDYRKAYDYFLEKGYKSKAKTAKPEDLGSSFHAKITFKSGKNLSLSDKNVIIYPDSEKPAQVWEFVRLSGGAYKIINTKNSLCLSVAGDSKTSGSNVELAMYDGSAGQKWYIYKNGSKYVLRPYCSSYCVLDVKGASTTDLTNVQIATNDNATGQLFKFTMVDSETTERMTDIGQDAYYKLTNVAAGTNLDIDNLDVIANTPDTSPDQVWRFIHQADGSYKVVNQGNNKTLEVAGGSDAAGINVQTAVSDSTAGQQWYVYRIGDRYTLRPACSETTRMEISENNSALTGTADGSNKQLFTMTKVDYLKDVDYANLGDDFYAKLTNSASGKNMSLSSTNVISNPASDAPAQVWRFVRQEDGSYQIINQKNGKLLDLETSGEDGTNVCINAANGSQSQNWFVYYKVGKYLLRPATSEKCVLTVADGSTEDGANIQINTFTETKSQRFAITKIDYLNDSQPANMGDSFYSKITGIASSKSLSLSETNVILYQNTSSNAQIWKFVRQDDGSYEIVNQKNNLLLTVEDPTQAAPNVHVAADTNATTQRWFIYAKEGNYVLQPACASDQLLEVAGGGDVDGTNIQTGKASYSAEQIFGIEDLDYTDSDTNQVGATDAQMEVIRKIIYAVETGGQVYGNVDYANFTEAYTNSSEEHAITIGGGQWYATEAKQLLNLIRETDPALFASLDTAGIAQDLDAADWSTYKLSKTSAKAKCIVSIISTDVGIRCQDQLIDEQMEAYMVQAKSLGVDNLDALMMCANIRHQGGLGALQRVLGKTATPYTLDNIYAALQTDTGNQVGAYTSRQKFVYNTLKQYISGNAGSNVKYLPACDSSQVSIVDALNAAGIPNVDAEYRMRLAIANGIEDYAYTAEQNTKLLELMKKGMLIDPEGTVLTGWYTLTGGKRYYYNDSGVRHFGWLTLGTKTYYLDTGTGVMVTGTQVIDGVTYEFGTDGVLNTKTTCSHETHNTDGFCVNCGEEVGHTHTSTVTEPTCTAMGYTTYTCVCGDSYQLNYTEPLGHSYVDGFCHICDAENPDYKVIPTISLAAASVSFEDEILYNLYFTAENLVSSTDDMGLIMWDQEPELAAIDGNGTIIPGAVYDESANRYLVSTDGIAAKLMGDTKYLLAYAKHEDGSYVYSDLYPFSAKAYCKNRLEKSSNKQMKALCMALMNYGAEAQLFFNYKTDELMNADLENYQYLVAPYSSGMLKPRTAVTEAKAGQFGTAASGFTALSASMSANGSFALNYYFTTAFPTSTVTFYYWTAEDYESAGVLTPENASGSTAMTAVSTENTFWAEYAGIAPKYIDETVFVCGVYEWEGVTYSTGVIPYSIGFYCTRKADAAGDMQTLAMATVVYCYYAKSYFGIN